MDGQRMPFGIAMTFAIAPLVKKLMSPAVAASFSLALALASPALAADNPAATELPQGAAVTVLKATKFCFPNVVEAFGILIARDESMVRPERPGLKVAEIMAEPGDTVTSGQVLARLIPAEGG